MGLLLGIALGAMLALAAAWYVTRHSPFRTQSAPTVTPSEIPKEILGMPRSQNGGAPTEPTPPQSVATQPGSAPLAAAALEPAATPPVATPNATSSITGPVPPAPSAPPAANERWFWQVGAFGSEQEANRVRAELALLGLTSHVEPTRMDDGRTLYRVRVGPYPSQQAAQAVRNRLQGAGYQPVMVRG